MKKPRPKPTIPHDPAERPATMRAMVKIDAARKARVEALLVAASCQADHLREQIKLLTRELADTEAERDHLARVSRTGEEESDVPVRYQVRGDDLCAIRDDEPEKWPDDNSSVVLARRSATAEDRTVPLPFDRFAELAERAGEPPLSILASANPDSPSPEKPYAVGDTLERVECGEALYTVRIAGGGPDEWILESAETGCEVPEPEIRKTTAELRRDYVRVEPMNLPSPEKPAPHAVVGDRLTHPVHGEAVVYCIDEGAACMAESPDSFFCTLPAGHEGDHEAGGESATDPVVDRWPQSAASGPEHEPSLAVKKNRPADDDFSDDPEAARDAAADIAREEARARKVGARAEEDEPVRDRVCRSRGCQLFGAETALEECIGCEKPTSPLPNVGPQEGGKASPDTAAGIRTLLVERLGARGAKRAEGRARAACEGVGPDERLIECADIGGVDQRLRKLLVRLLELEPTAKSGAPKARKGGAK